jgi:hypothetical protein
LNFWLNWLNFWLNWLVELLVELVDFLVELVDFLVELVELVKLVEFWSNLVELIEFLVAAFCDGGCFPRGSLIYLLDLGEVMEEVTAGLVNCQLPYGLLPGLEGKWWGTYNWPLP